MSRRPLDTFTDRELIGELARRRKDLARDEEEKEWCDDCANFSTWVRDLSPPNNYNPCSFGHRMRFKEPEGYTDCFGFFMNNCKDRK